MCFVVLLVVVVVVVVVVVDHNSVENLGVFFKRVDGFLHRGGPGCHVFQLSRILVGWKSRNETGIGFW